MKQFFITHWALLSILVVAILVRSYKITNPVLDWHAFRQADTASVTREYVKHGINVLYPKYQDLSNIQSGKDNLDGYRMVEFPFLNAGAAELLRAFPRLPADATQRGISVLFSIGTLVSLFLLVKKISGSTVGYLTLIIGALLPYNIYYSRVIMPEPAFIFFTVFALLGFYLWLEQKAWWWYGLSLLSLVFALLLKPFVIFLAPVFLAIVWVKKGKKSFKTYGLIPYAILAIIPFLLWRKWITQFPSGIPASDWLFNGDGIRFRPAWFRWLFFERLIKLMLGYLGSIFFAANLFKLPRKELIIYGSWWLGSLVYLSVIATGNVRHDYYQVLLIPIVIITFARGIAIFVELLQRKLSPLVVYSITLLLVVGGLGLSWWQIKEYYHTNHTEYIVAGKAVDQLTPADAKVIAPAFGDTQFLYQTNRTGWPIGFEVEKKKALGAEYYITTSYDDEARELESKYFTLEKTPDFLLLDLTRQKTK